MLHRMEVSLCYLVSSLAPPLPPSLDASPFHHPFVLCALPTSKQAGRQAGRQAFQTPASAVPLRWSHDRMARSWPVLYLPKRNPQFLTSRPAIPSPAHIHGSLWMIGAIGSNKCHASSLGSDTRIANHGSRTTDHGYLDRAVEARTSNPKRMWAPSSCRGLGWPLLSHSRFMVRCCNSLYHDKPGPPSRLLLFIFALFRI